MLRLPDYSAEVLDQIEEPVSVLAYDGTVLYVNRVGAEVAGYRPEDMIGRLAWDFLPESERPSAIEHFEEIKAKGCLPPVRRRISVAADGEVVLVETAGYPGTFHGEPCVVYGGRHVETTEMLEERLELLESLLRDHLPPMIELLSSADGETPDRLGQLEATLAGLSEHLKAMLASIEGPTDAGGQRP